jgi:hypothetical protein
MQKIIVIDVIIQLTEFTMGVLTKMLSVGLQRAEKMTRTMNL